MTFLGIWMLANKQSYRDSPISDMAIPVVAAIKILVLGSQSFCWGQ